MKKTVLVISFVSFVLTPFSQVTNDVWLANSFHPISTDAKNIDFADLQFLKEDIKDKKIVAIGEQMHQDGKTFEARSRVIQFLIKEMGFKAIIFEAGIFDVNYGWKSFVEQDNIQNFTKSIMSEWRYPEQHKELFSFIEEWKQDGNDLEMDGFDCKYTSKHRKKYTNILDSIVCQINPEIKNHPDYCFYYDFHKEFGDATFIKAAFPGLSKRKIKTFLKGSELVKNTLKSVNHPFLQTVVSMDQGIVLYSKTSIFKLIFNKKSVIALNNGRDILMAEALNHLLENEYKDKKVILFGATYHFIRNNNELTTVKKIKIPIPESTIMGDLIYKQYNKEIYTIGFAAYSGYYGVSQKGNRTGGKEIIPAKEGSLEKKLHDTCLGDGILILSNKDEKSDWWYKNISIRLFSYESAHVCKDWSHVVDAVFYIDEMDPSYEE